MVRPGFNCIHNHGRTKWLLLCLLRVNEKGADGRGWDKNCTSDKLVQKFHTMEKTGRWVEENRIPTRLTEYWLALWVLGQGDQKC